MKNRFQFYEVVAVVASDESSLESVIGKEGTILGMAQDEESQRWSYSVSIASTDKVWTFDERQLESTGKYQNRSDVYSNDTVRVQVDPDTGRGSVK